MAVPDTDPDVNVGFNVLAPIKLQPAGALISVQLKEVAEEAGVSTATVSRALRGLQHVNDATRAKIIAAAE